MPTKIEETKLEITKVSISKGVTIPMEAYGGDKFEMLRIDLTAEVRVGGGITFDTATDELSALVDRKIGQMVEEEIQSIKSRKG